MMTLIMFRISVSMRAIILFTYVESQIVWWGKMNTKAVVTGIASLVMAQAASSAPTVEELWEKIQQQEVELKALKKEQKETEQKLEATADAIDSAGVDKSLEWASKTKIGGYGEHHYNKFNGKDDKVDAHRYVLYISHEYSDSVRFFSEFELEHGLAGNGDDKPGEVELEQAYIEWDFAENHSLVAGQFLVPVGILNETHEPDTFYGTERNLVEKNIIPTTWWETGAMMNGRLASGLSYDVAVHSGLENSEGRIRSGRQKSAKATANDFAYTGRLKYTGVPGLELAFTAQYQEDISQGDLAAASATLVETHAIYSVGNASVRALWASWDIDGDEAEIAGNDSQGGFYIEPSYKVLENVGVFARYSEWDNQLNAQEDASVSVVDVGVNFWLHPNVVFKADLSEYRDGSGNDSINLGLGWSF